MQIDTVHCAVQVEVCSKAWLKSGIVVCSLSALCFEMVKTGRKVFVRGPPVLKPGYYFVFCRAYTTEEGITYDYKLYSRWHKALKCQARGPRKMLSFNFACRGGAEKRLDIHRALAMSSDFCNGGELPWTSRAHVHHCAHPARKPWSNCREKNMRVLDRRDHIEHHRRRAGRRSGN